MRFSRLKLAFGLAVATAMLSVTSAFSADAPQTADSAVRPDPPATASGAMPPAGAGRAGLVKKKTNPYLNPVLKKDPANAPAGADQSPVAAPAPPGYQQHSGAKPPTAQSPAPAQPPPQIPNLGSMMPGGGQNGSSSSNDYEGPIGNGRTSCVATGDAAAACNCNSEGFKSLGEAKSAAIDFYSKKISAGDDSEGQRVIAINDYRSKIGCMYIMDTAGSCKFATTSSWGSGSNNRSDGSPTPGCGNGSKMSPPGFHITTSHAGGKYNTSNSLGMAGLQGQGSTDRGILIHQGSCNGGATTWGCSGVGDFVKVQSMLGVGSLVYNYFGAKESVGCPSGVDTPYTPDPRRSRPDPITGLGDDAEGDLPKVNSSRSRAPR